MRMKIIVDIKTKESNLDKGEIKADLVGFAKEFFVKALMEFGIVIEIEEVELCGEGKRDWKEHFMNRFERGE